MRSLFTSSRISTAVYSAHRAFSTMESAIKVTQKSKLLVLELNRPKALNALSLEMCEQIKSLMLEKVNVPNTEVGAFLMKGAGGKAFCAGGDVKAIWQELQTAGTESPKPLPLAVVGSGKPGYAHTDFFRQEYIMNYLLGTSLAPQVSFWDGIVMGGGVGVSVLGEFRVATEKSLFAMPETAIGLFPDVGSSAWLPHLPDGYGAFIGLSGWRLGPADLIHTGIATHFISSDKLAAVEAEIENGLPVDPAESRKHIKAILDSFQSQSDKPDPSSSLLAKNQAAIVKCFGEKVQSMEQVMELLKEESDKGNEWATKTAEMLGKMSPTSMKITLQQLRRGKSLDLKGCLKMEFRMMMGCMKGNDFKEGIRAVLVERDNKPVWSPGSLAEVSDAAVESYFNPLGEYELTVD